MAGYVTQTRSVVLPTLPLKVGFKGSAGTTINYVLPTTSQTTRSWRSGRGDEDRDELDGARRIFRNGFTSNDPMFDMGHEFSTTKSTISIGTGDQYFLYDDQGLAIPPRFYRGPLLPIRSGQNYSSDIPPMPSGMVAADVSTFGANAIHATVPTAPQANTAQFVAELFEALPQIPGRTIAHADNDPIRSASKEYINWEFGVAPSVSDVKAISKSLNQAYGALRQLKRDNGRHVRRSFGFPETSSTTEEIVPVTGNNYFMGVNNLRLKSGSGSPPIRVLTTTSRRVWFSGAYTYYIPMDDSIMSRIERHSAEANRLLGIRAGADVGWELLPWSWLIDWKASVGTLISNANRFSEDGLVMRYGYLMCHSKVTRQIVSPTLTTDLGWVIPSSSVTLTSERKERFQATPYGFGVKTDSFTARQWAILAALGLSRDSRQMRTG